MTDTPDNQLNPPRPSQAYTPRQDLELKSEYFQESRCQATMTTTEVLDSIEEQIAEIEAKLKSIKEEKATLSAGSQEYVDLQDRRRLLKKELIDLDYQHSLYCDKLKGEQLSSKALGKEDKKDREETEVEVNEVQSSSNYQSLNVDYERRVQQELEKIQKDSRVRIEQLKQEMNSTEKDKKQNGTETGPKRKSNITTEEELQKNLIQAEYRSRMAQLELEMTSLALKRTREVELEAELTALQLANTPLLPSYDLVGSPYLPESPLSGLGGYLGLYREFGML